MNHLTKVLLEDLLGDGKKKITAIYGGGFKPPTKGHFDVVAKAAEQNPEIDDFIIYVGGGERNGVAQGESIQIWELYKKYLPMKVRIEPSKAPVGDILRYAKDHPEEEVLWIIGARENNPEDFADISYRTRTLDKYPNLQLRIIQTSGGVSGTAARNAVKANDKEQFFNMIPDIKEKQQVWDIVSPVVKEGIIDNTKDKLKKFIIVVKQESQETRAAVGLIIKSAKGEITLTDEQKKQIGEQLKDILKLVGLTAIAALPGGFIVGALIKLFKAEHLITPSSMMNELVTDTEVICDNCGWEWPIADGGDDLYICHKCGHDNNPDLEEGSCGYDTNVATGKKLNTPGGLEEADPKKGTGKKPEGSSRRLYTDEDPKDTVRIKFKTKEDIVDTLNKTSFKAKSHARQSQVINLIHQRVRAAYGKSKDPEVRSRLKRALDYIEKRKEMSKKKTERLRKMKEASDPQAGTALPYGSGFAPVKENDPFGLNELARQFVKEALIETWKPEESFVSLSKYMIDNGMNIKPLPKIKVISDDKDNASNLLGKTAYYNPTDKSITLYTMDRHPKDILRSFSHEMVHHEQNLDGKLNNINTTNTNEDGALPEIEREAYEKGNMMLRNWEDSLKNV
jgi:hypothetical protein